MAPKAYSENAIARLKHEDLLDACVEWKVDVAAHWRPLEIRAALARVIWDATHPPKKSEPAGERGRVGPASLLISF